MSLRKRTIWLLPLNALSPGQERLCQRWRVDTREDAPDITPARALLHNDAHEMLPGDVIMLAWVNKRSQPAVRTLGVLREVGQPEDGDASARYHVWDQVPYQAQWPEIWAIQGGSAILELTGSREELVASVLPTLTDGHALFPVEAPGEPEPTPEYDTLIPLDAMDTPPTNEIWQGPPGTGKTWRTRGRALTLCGFDPASGDGEDGKRQFEKLQREHRVAFVTFHQSYAYEDFVEGIRPLLSSEDAESSEDGEPTGLRYECKDGIFKQLALLAASEYVADIEKKVRESEDFAQLWSAYLDDIEQRTHTVTNATASVDYKLRRTSHNNVTIHKHDRSNNKTADQSTYTINARKAELMWEHRGALGEDPPVTKIGALMAEELGLSSFVETGCWIIYKDFLRFEANYQGSKVAPETATPTLTRVAKIQRAKDALVGKSDFDFGKRDVRHHVLIIDEINRGNISKILGELITLLEPSKRLGMRDELRVTLPYSGEVFAVPPNLHVIGTMNTADRSIALLDTALRRRFKFKELMGDAEVIRQHVEGELPRTDGEHAWTLGDLTAGVFEVLNARIEHLYDRDHTLGHAPFLEVRDVFGLADVMLEYVIPLLQEYFYDDWDRIALVLGCPYKLEQKAATPARTQKHSLGTSGYKAPILTATQTSEDALFGVSGSTREAHLSYQVSPWFCGADRDEQRLLEALVALLPEGEGSIR